MLSVHDLEQLQAASKGYDPGASMNLVDIDTFAKMLGTTHSAIWSMRRRKDPDFPPAAPISVPLRGGRRETKLRWPKRVAEAFVEIYRERKARDKAERQAKREKKVAQVKAPEPRLPKKKKRAVNPLVNIIAKPVVVREGFYDVFEGVPIPRISQAARPEELALYRVDLVRPWVTIKPGQSFFVPGVKNEKIRDFYGKHCRRFVYVNGVPGVMVWRVS